MSITTPDWDLKLHHELAELGADMSVRDASIGIYLPMHPERPSYPVLRDVRYGEHPRNRLDVHAPEGNVTELLPVLVFVHGGGFAGGDKVRAGEPFYDNIGRWAVESGLVAVNMTYRLAPEFTYPSGSLDVAAAFSWVRENIAGHGGDPNRIVVMGHSAGAAHVATFVARPDLLAGGAPAGAILSSGVYDPTLGAGVGVYYDQDPAVLATQSSLDGLRRSEVPLLLSTAELDPPSIQAQTKHLLDALFEQRGAFPQLVQAEGHNHFSVMLHIGTTEHWYTDRLFRFIIEPQGAI